MSGMEILFITGRRLSEVVLATPLLARLLRSYPDAAVDILCPKGAEELFAGLPQTRRIVTISPPGAWKRRMQNLKSFRQTEYDLVVDLGYRVLVPFLRYRKLLRPDGRQQHVAERYANVWPSSHPVRPEVWLSPRVIENAQRKLQGCGRPLIAIDASSHSPYKRWPLTQWRALFSHILAHKGFENTTFLVLGSQSEARQVETLVHEFPMGRMVNLVGLTTVGEVAAHVRQCDVFIGLEGGIMHLAAAQKVPTVGLFGPSVEALWAPVGERVAALFPPTRHPHEVSLPRGTLPRVMSDISVQDVLCKLRQLWEDKLP